MSNERKTPPLDRRGSNPPAPGHNANTNPPPTQSKPAPPANPPPARKN